MLRTNFTDGLKDDIQKLNEEIGRLRSSISKDTLPQIVCEIQKQISERTKQISEIQKQITLQITEESKSKGYTRSVSAGGGDGEGVVTGATVGSRTVGEAAAIVLGLGHTTCWHELIS